MSGIRGLCDIWGRASCEDLGTAIYRNFWQSISIRWRRLIRTRLLSEVLPPKRVLTLFAFQDRSRTVTSSPELQVCLLPSKEVEVLV